MFSWPHKAPCERRRRKHLGEAGGMLPKEIFKIEYSETPFPAFLEPRQCWRSLKFSFVRETRRVILVPVSGFG